MRSSLHKVKNDLQTLQSQIVRQIIGFNVFYCDSVKAYDSSCPEKGAVFEVPITVVKPETVHNEIAYNKQHFAPGDIQRRFINVPEGATWGGSVIY